MPYYLLDPIHTLRIQTHKIFITWFLSPNNFQMTYIDCLIPDHSYISTLGFQTLEKQIDLFHAYHFPHN